MSALLLTVVVLVAWGELALILHLAVRIRYEREKRKIYEDGYKSECAFSDFWRHEAFRANGIESKYREFRRWP